MLYLAASGKPHNTAMRHSRHLSHIGTGQRTDTLVLRELGLLGLQHPIFNTGLLGLLCSLLPLGGSLHPLALAQHHHSNTLIYVARNTFKDIGETSLWHLHSQLVLRFGGHHNAPPIALYNPSSASPSPITSPPFLYPFTLPPFLNIFPNPYAPSPAAIS